MILFVDYEHERGRSQIWGEKVLAARTWITYRLEDLAGLPCHLVRYDRVSTALVRQLDVRAIFISGNGTDPALYDPAAVAPLHELIRAAAVPMFGFCGGFQCMVQALGLALRPIEVDDATPPELLRSFGGGRMGEAGYHPIDLIGEHELLAGLDSMTDFLAATPGGAMLGIATIGAAFAGYMLAPMRAWERWYVGVVSLLFIAPGLATMAIGVMAMVPVILVQMRKRASRAPTQPSP
mgnify:CR=1 FL=1